MKYLPLFSGMLIIYLLPSLSFSQNQQLADSLYKKGMSFDRSGNYRQAEYYLRESFNLYDKKMDSEAWLTPGISYAEVLTDRSKYDQALPIFTKLKKAVILQQNTKARARIENDLGWMYNRQGKNDTALTYFHNAIPLAEEAADTLRLGYIYNNIGSVYYAHGDYKTSLEYRKKSLYYKNKTDNKRSIAIGLANLGIIYKKLLLYDKALHYYKQSLAICEQLNNTDLLALLNSNIGIIYDELGNPNQALLCYKKSLDYRKKGGNPEGTAVTINNIGTLYNQLGQPKRALAYYRECLQIIKKITSPASKAASYRNIANRLYDLNQADEAIIYYKQALRLRKQYGNPFKVAYSLLDLARIEQHRNHLSLAFEYVKQARATADSAQNISLLEKTWSRLGSLHKKEDGVSTAIPYYLKAYAYSQSLEEPRQLGPLMNLAYAYNHANSDSALFYGRRAADIIEEGRSRSASLSKLKTSYFRRYSDFYVNLASWALKYKKDLPGAYHFIEMAKARSLTDDLTKAAQQVDDVLPEKERINRIQKQSVISNLYVSLKNTSDSTKKQILQHKIRKKELNFTVFESKLHKKYPKYKVLENPHPVSLRQTQEMCSAQTAILEYAISRKKLITFFITKNDVKTNQFIITHQKAADQANLAVNISQFRQAILSKAPEDSINNLARPLYKKLIAPFDKSLTKYPNLLIVPDSYLAYLPFEALKKDNNYLVSEYNIKYVPSITAFSLISPPRNRDNQKLLAIGNSADNVSSHKTPLLPTVGMEIQSISRMFDHAKICQNKHIAEGKVKKLMSNNYSFIHIAAHSVIDERHSFMSGIILDPDKRDTDLLDDGYLRSSEIFGMNIPSDLVVLSACKSGMGQLVSGEGMLGLQRAFFSAGTSAVMVSLWNVYDRSTTRFMQTFYQSLLHKKNSWSNMWNTLLCDIGWRTSFAFDNTAAAVRKAKLSLLHSAKYHHPVYWAPFVLVGR